MPVREPYAQALRIVLVIGAAALTLTPLAAGPAAAAPSGFRYWNPEDTATVPKTLSAMGLYVGAPGKNAPLIPQAWHYEVNVPEWTDGAGKRHWVVLNSGRSIAFNEKSDYWGYPDSAVFVEEISIDTNALDTNSRVVWETRVLINKKDSVDPSAIADHWYGYSYLWRKSQLDADLVNLTHGLDTSIRVWPNGTGAGKIRSEKKWHFPTMYQCNACHRAFTADTVHGRALLGFFTAQLNRAAPDTVGLNQLDWFFAKGVLAGQKPGGWDLSPRWRKIEDSSASIEVRARSYIAANCSGCHGRRGIATAATFGVNLNFDFHDLQVATEVRNYATVWSWGLDTVQPFFYKPNDPANFTQRDTIIPALVVPGYPEKSVLLFRLSERNTLPITDMGGYDIIHNQMPPLATFQVDVSALALLKRWVKEMASPSTGLLQGRRPSTAASFWLRGRILTIAPEAGRGNIGVTGGNGEVSMVSVAGRRVDLRRLSPGSYEVPAGLPKGLYLIRAGTRSILRALF